MCTKPRLQAGKNKPSTPKIQKEYSRDGLSGYSYTVSSLKAVRHRNILFVFMVLVVFFHLESGELFFRLQSNGDDDKDSEVKFMMVLLLFQSGFFIVSVIDYFHVHFINGVDVALLGQMGFSNVSVAFSFRPDCTYFFFVQVVEKFSAKCQIYKKYSCYYYYNIKYFFCALF